MRYKRVHLVLMVTHRCNLHCDYCYVGAQIPHSMDTAVGRRTIDRAIGIAATRWGAGTRLFWRRAHSWKPSVEDCLDYPRGDRFHGIVVAPGDDETNATVVTPPLRDILLRRHLDVWGQS